MAQKEKIDYLLLSLRELEKLIAGMRDAEIYPVSFFSQCFSLSHQIINDLHGLETAQLDELGRQIEAHRKLIESIPHREPVSRPVEPANSANPGIPLRPTGEAQAAPPVPSPSPASQPQPPFVPQPVETPQPVVPPEPIATSRPVISPPPIETLAVAETEVPSTSPAQPAEENIRPMPETPRVLEKAILENRPEAVRSETTETPPPPFAAPGTGLRETPMAHTRPTVAPHLTIGEKPSVSLNEVLEKKNLSDFRKAFSLNDRFRFRRELFGGDEEKMNRAIRELNELHTFEDSIAYLHNELKWNVDDAAVAGFIQLLEKRFS